MGLKAIEECSSSDVPSALDSVPDITDDVNTLSLEVLDCGGCADIYRGEWRVTYSGRNGVRKEFSYLVRSLTPFLHGHSCPSQIVIKALRRFANNYGVDPVSNVDEVIAWMLYCIVLHPDCQPRN
jgi:hypothetical protein